MPLVTLHEAVERAREVLPPGPVEWLPTEACLGRVLARDLAAPFALPRASQSLMDGYAVRSEDTQDAASPGGLSLLLSGPPSAAGHPAEAPLSAGTCRRILTGAPLPPGADAVVPQEEVRLDGDRIVVGRPVPQGQWVTVPGEEIAAGEKALHAGDLLTPARLSLAVALGCAVLPVVRRCRVAVLGTGDELCELGEPLGAQSRYADSRYLIAALVRQAGAQPIHLGRVGDDAGRIAHALQEANADLVISTGGAGQGDKDFLVRAWARLGLRPLFTEIALRPGHGTACAATSTTLYFALPGGPLAAEIVFHELIVPVLQKWFHSSEGAPPRLSAQLLSPVKNKSPLWRAVTGTASFRDNSLWFQPFDKHQGRHFSRRRQKNAYALIPPRSPLLKRGQRATLGFFLGHLPLVQEAP